MTGPTPVVLCVDDEPALRAVLKEQLRRDLGRDCLIELAEDGAEALEIFADCQADGVPVAVVISDQVMPGMRGDELLAQLHAQAPEVIKIMLTGQAGIEAVQAAVNSANLYRYLTKPWDAEDLALTVRQALRAFDDARQLRAQHALLTEMNAAALDLTGNLGAADRYQRLTRRATRLVPADRAALFALGEAGPRVLGLEARDELPSGDLAALVGQVGDRITRTGPDRLWPGAPAALRVPLSVDGACVGLLALASAEPGAFDAVDDARLEALAALASASLRTGALVDALEAAAEHRRQVAAELARQASEAVAGPLLGDSAAVQALRESISELAMHTDSVLITGAPGAGGEAAARAIHAESARSGRPFLKVNCALIASLDEIFGDEDTPDRRALAAGGTLFLAGVNRLTAAMQDELAVRVSIGADVRLIGSTFTGGRNPTGRPQLQQALQLAFTHRLAVPSLADRFEDLPALANFFLRRHAANAGRRVEPLSEGSLARLEGHVWPGNLPELSGVIQRALVRASGAQVEVDWDLLVPVTRLGGYRLIRQLATGGMGEVWLAEHGHLARPAAIKLIRGDANTGKHEALAARFRREAAATARLTSPHTFELYDYGVAEDGAFYYVMELLQGLDVHTLVADYGPLSPARVIHLLRQACRSLDEAHALGMVHRDIKPGNLFVGRAGLQHDFLKVLDFGMVTPLYDEADLALTSPDSITGTPEYLAPEGFTRTGEVDRRADIYSLGCVAWWMLLGRPVFLTTSLVATAYAHLETAPPDLLTLDPSIPSELASLIARCLAKDPKERPFSAQALERRLAQLQLEHPWTDTDATEWWRLFAPDVTGSPPPA